MKRVTWVLCKQYSPFNGKNDDDILFSFYDVCVSIVIIIASDCCCRGGSSALDSVAADSLSCSRLHLHESLLCNNRGIHTYSGAVWVSVSSRFLSLHLFSLTQHGIGYAPPASWVLTASLLRASISQVGSPTAGRGGALFVLFELTADPADHKSCWKRSERME